MKVRVSYERRRGCGFRKVGGLYLVSDGPAAPCGRFPVPAETCPTCGGGIKPALGWTWIDGDAFKATAPPCSELETCWSCPMAAAPERILGRCGLIWVGTMYYKTPAEFCAEAEHQGISRRIPYLPKGFDAGATWVFLGHRAAIPCECVRSALAGGGSDLVDSCERCGGTGGLPGLFAIWKPARAEVVVDESTDDETLEGYMKRGLEPVIVRPIEPGLEFDVIQGGKGVQ